MNQANPEMLTEAAVKYGTSSEARMLTSQERQFCVYMARGMGPEAAARNAGIPKTSLQDTLKKAEIAETMAVLRQQVRQYSGTLVTKELLTDLLFEAHATSATSTEKVGAIKELAKIHGLYEAQQVTITTKHTRVEQFESMSDEELIKHAALRIELRNTPPVYADIEELEADDA